MELQHLSYFKKIAELEHMTNASFELHVAQPVLSRIVRSLEAEFGAPLFIRNGKTLKLNNSGKTLLKYIDAIESSVAQLSIEMEASRNVEDSITLLASITPRYLPGLIGAFTEKYPNYRVNLLLNRDNTDLMATDCDFQIFCSLPTDIIPDNCISILLEELMVAVPNYHPLANAASIRLEDLKHENFILPTNAYTLRHIIDHYCQLVCADPKIVLEYSDYSSIHEIIAAGCGIAIVPRLSWSMRIYPNISLLHICEPVCIHSVYLKWRSDKPLPQVGQSFRDFAVSYMEQLSRDW